MVKKITKFVATQLACGSERIELHRISPPKLFSRSKTGKTEKIPFSEWNKQAARAGLVALTSAHTLDTEREMIERRTSVEIPVAVVAGLNESEATALGLPPVSRLALQLRSSGSLAQGTITVEAKWVRHGGLLTRASVEGARIREGKKTGRLVERLRSVYLAASAVNQAQDADKKRVAFAELRKTLGDEINDKIDADGYIERLRIAYAANFSLDIKTSKGQFDFDPVLFAKQASETDEGELVDEKDKSLLTVTKKEQFQKQFKQKGAGKRSYLLSDGSILFVDPLLGSALDVVHQKQSALHEERRAFIRSPQSVLREELKLDEQDDDEGADRLFIETQQFSERVNGIQVWQKPVLPWIKLSPKSWLPESFGLQIGDTYIPLVPGDAEKIVKQAYKANAVGEERFSFQGQNIPATSATIKAAQAIADMEKTVQTKKKVAPTSDKPRELPKTFFLQVGDNFENLGYTRLPSRRREQLPSPPPALPEGVKSTPKDHQITGFHWLVEAWTEKLPGVLLADDMGLGKTFQALAFLLWLRVCKTPNKPPNRPVLIVAPTGLLKNWQAEIKTHLAPAALDEIVEAFGHNLSQFRSSSGEPRAKNDIRGGTSRLDISTWDKAGVVLTTYETMRDYHISFARTRFSAIVYDEVQKLKNPASQIARAAKALNADFQIAMTGTPVENRLQDLWSISDTIYPGFLGTSREFETNYPPEKLDRLKQLQSLLVERDVDLPAFMLRRMKEDILTGLPTKTLQTYEIPMPPAQAVAYDTVLARAQALRQSETKGAMLKVLHMLRGTSLHPESPRGVDNIDDYIAKSARLTKTFELLEDIKAKREKALVFCESLEMQSFLAAAIQERFNLTRRPMCISGSVPGFKRQAMVAAFQQAPAGFDAMILSPKAGGVGLTITAANHVIHLSRWWNPAVEDQATDRVYRIGQLRPVTVHLPMAVHSDAVIGPASFDVRLNALMERKRSLSRGLLMPPESAHDIEVLLGDVLDGKPETPSQAAQPKAAQPEAAQPKAAQPEAAQPKAAQPKAAQPEAAQPKAAQPEAAQPKAAQPEAAQPEAAQTKTETSKPLSLDEAQKEQPKRQEAAVPEEITEEASTEAKSPARPILTPRDTPVHVAEQRSKKVQRIEFERYGLRDWAIFTQYLDGTKINQMKIMDPYCLASAKQRQRVVDFVHRFTQHAAFIKVVQVTAYDSESTNPDSLESRENQRDDLEQRWKSQIENVTLHTNLHSRRAQGKLHDRSVKAFIDDNSTIIWDLGSGIDGIMTAYNMCTVTATRVESVTA